MIGNILDPGGSSCENEDQIANELKQVSQKIQERDNKYAIDPTKHMPELDEYSSVDDLVILFALLCLLTLSHYIHLPHVLLRLLLWVPFSLVSSGEFEI